MNTMVQNKLKYTLGPEKRKLALSRPSILSFLEVCPMEYMEVRLIEASQKPDQGISVWEEDSSEPWQNVWLFSMTFICNLLKHVIGTIYTWSTRTALSFEDTPTAHPVEKQTLAQRKILHCANEAYHLGREDYLSN